MSDYITNNDMIIFTHEFNKPLDLELINKYKNLIFSNYILNNDLFDKYKNNDIIFMQYIGSKFNQEVNNLPNSLTHLTFGNDFNQEVNNLPNSLTHLTFDSHFNQEVNNLPNSLTHLTFGYDFNQEVNNLPNTLIHLIFGWSFGWSFNREVNNLPKHLIQLTFGDNFNQEVNNLPNSLTHLIFGWYFNQEVNNLPNSLIHLTFGVEFNQPINNLPNSLTHLTFRCDFNQKIKQLPNSLTHLTFGYNFNQKVDLSFNIKYLKLDCNNQYLIDNLHDGIEELVLEHNFDLELNNLPSSIKKISFDKNSSYNKELNCLPNFIEIIELPYYYMNKILKIPLKLKKLVCHKKYIYINDYNNIDIEFYK